MVPPAPAPVCTGRLVLADVVVVVEGSEGTCRRQITHGMMKYRGSTSGAVINDRAVDRRKMMRKEVLGPSCAACPGTVRGRSVSFDVFSICVATSWLSSFLRCTVVASGDGHNVK